MTKGNFMINGARLDDKIKEQDLKIWWIAERIRVDRKTVSRWLSGKVKWILEENLDALARLLDCPRTELILTNSCPMFATSEDNLRAAQLLQARDFINLIAPTGQYDLGESVIRALLSPKLPASILAELYLHLSHCCRRQNKLADAEAYLKHSQEISKKLDRNSTALPAFPELMPGFQLKPALTTC